MTNQYEAKLIHIINQQDWLIESLKIVRNLKLPDWYIAAGAIRNTVWNYLNNFPTTFHQQDVDVVYFDSSDMKGEIEKRSEEILREKSPHLKWEVVNQARGHLFEHGKKMSPQVKSSYESIAYWSETPTCVGVRLEENNKFTICAPHGLDDLMNLIVQPIPPPYQDLSFYQKRISEKSWEKFWPKLKIVKK